MIESHLDVGGAVVFWSLSDGTDRERLRAGFTPLGLAFHVPEPRPPSAALRDALEDILGGPRVLIRPLADRDGFVVVREDRGQDQNAYTTELVARVRDDDPPVLAFDPIDDRAARVAEAFRKHIGRALLNQDHDPYLAVWNIDLMTKEALKQHAHLRQIDRERQIEAEVTRILRQHFSFRFIVLEGQAERMGSRGLEASLIGTIARCDVGNASNTWLGHHSPIEKVQQSGLWLVQHLKAEPLSKNDKARVLASIAATSSWLRGVG